MPPEAGPKDMLWLPPHDHIKPFDGTNYDGWAPPVRALLEAHSTWSIICGKRTRPTPPVAKLEWSQDDEKGAGIILWNCAPSIQQELISAQEQGDGEYGSYQSLGRYRWEYLKRMYKSDVDAMSTLEAFKRHRELFSYRFAESTIIPLSGQLKRMEELNNSLKGTRFALSPNTFVALVLHALPEPYSNIFEGHVVSLGKDNPLDYERVKKLILEEEKGLKSQAAQSRSLNVQSR